jgi:hypothetical protein
MKPKILLIISKMASALFIGSSVYAGGMGGGGMMGGGEYLMIKSMFAKIKQNYFLAIVLGCAIPTVGIASMGEISI